jgi:enamine deaminase RidA (YjgF/YER057c/UK114 family)
MRSMLACLLVGAVAACTLAPPARAEEPSKVTFYGAPTAQISSGVSVPGGRAYYFSSGTVPATLTPAPAKGNPFGDTKTQAVSILNRIKTLLAENGLSLSDVVYLRAYLVPDKEKGKTDFEGWFDAYGQFFNRADNPVKPARSTVAVAGLVNPDWLIEIEAVAVYPQAAPARK